MQCDGYEVISTVRTHGLGAGVPGGQGGAGRGRQAEGAAPAESNRDDKDPGTCVCSSTTQSERPPSLGVMVAHA